MEDRKVYKYSLISKYKFSFLALLLPVFLVVGQVVTSILGIKMSGFIQTESHSGSVGLQVACLLFLLYSIYSDWRNRNLFFDISITANGINLIGDDGVERHFPWERILSIEKFGRLKGQFVIKDEDYNKVGGVSGVRVFFDDGTKLVIYENISEYLGLIERISSNRPSL